MDKGKIVKTEWLLLGMTALFLCLLLALERRDRAALADTGVETETQVSQEEILPDLSPLDLNAAGAEELAELPGIGEVLSDRILKYRAQHGPFADWSEFLQIQGIGEHLVETLRPVAYLG